MSAIDRLRAATTPEQIDALIGVGGIRDAILELDARLKATEKLDELVREEARQQIMAKIDQLSINQDQARARAREFARRMAEATNGGWPSPDLTAKCRLCGAHGATWTLGPEWTVCQACFNDATLPSG